MNRKTKQILYGLLYFLIVLGIAAGVYFIYLEPAPTCSDGTQNQGELGVDCGGPCVECAIKQLDSLDISENAKVFSLNSSLYGVLSQVSNPNSNYKANISYTLTTQNNTGTLDEHNGRGVVYPKQSFWVHKNYELSNTSITGGQIEITDLKWERVEEMPILEIADSTSAITNNQIIIKGTLTNNSAVSVSKAKVIAILKSKSDSEVFSAQTVVDQVRPFRNLNFQISVPITESDASTIDLDNTQLLLGIVND